MKGLKAAFPLDMADEALRRAMQGHSGSQDETPIFVVGLPRSGSTLVEQILASHPQVYGAGEAHLSHAAMTSAIERWCQKACFALCMADRLQRHAASDQSANMPWQRHSTSGVMALV